MMNNRIELTQREKKYSTRKCALILLTGVALSWLVGCLAVFGIIHLCFWLPTLF